MNTWYRNAGKGKYHLAGDDWVRTGRAVCGRDISKPAFSKRATEDMLVSMEDAGKYFCKDCMKKQSLNAVLEDIRRLRQTHPEYFEKWR